MTIRSNLEYRLYRNGLSELSSKQIIDLSIPKINQLAEENNRFMVNWQSPSNDYPDKDYEVLYEIIKPIALKWIDENKPNALYRDTFA